MWMRLHIVCDRCKQVVKDAMKECSGSTAGYYEISGGRWGTVPANEGEKYLCDACMHGDPRYQAVYGRLAANAKDQCSVSVPHPAHDWCKGLAANREEKA